MVLIAVDRLNRRVVGYLCRNANALAYCCGECELEFDTAHNLELHMMIHMDKHVEQSHQMQYEPHSTTLQLNQNQEMEADTTNDIKTGVGSPKNLLNTDELVQPLTIKESESPLTTTDDSISPLCIDDGVNQLSTDEGISLSAINASISPLSTEVLNAIQMSTDESASLLGSDDIVDATAEEEIINQICIDHCSSPLSTKEIEKQLTTEEKEELLRLKFNLTPCSVSLSRTVNINDMKSESGYSESQTTDDEITTETDEIPVAKLKIRPRLSSNSKQSQRREHKCNDCLMVFKHGGYFRRHIMEAHTAERRFVCFLCGKKFSTNDQLTEHQQTHEPNSSVLPLYPCALCGKNVKNLKKHLRDHALEMERQTAEDNNIEQNQIFTSTLNGSTETVKWPNQTKMIRVKSELSTIADDNASDNKDASAIKRSAIKQENRLKNAKKRKLNGSQKESGQFGCKLCKKRFHLEAALIAHMNHHERPRFPCQICGKLLSKSYERPHLMRYHRPTIDMPGEELPLMIPQDVNYIGFDIEELAQSLFDLS